MTIFKTTLNAKHKKLNAKMVPFAGFEMPLQYTTIKEEIEAVRKNVGVFDVSHMGEFIVEGPDSLKFIGSMITNDIENLPDMKAIYSCLMNKNGGVIDDLICYKFSSNKILVCVNASNINKDFQWLKQNINEFNCAMTDISEKLSLLAIQGPASISVCAKILMMPNLSNLAAFSFCEHNFHGAPITIARTGYTGEDGIEIFCPNNVVNELWDILVEENNIKPCGLAARDSLRLEAGFPLYGHELSDEWSPVDSGLKWTVKMNKDSFVGKDFLALNTPKYRLIKFISNSGIPREKYQILDGDGKVIGFTTSGGHSFTIGKGIGMALISYPTKVNDPLFIDIRGQKVQITITNKFIKS